MYLMKHTLKTLVRNLGTVMSRFALETCWNRLVIRVDEAPGALFPAPHIKAEIFDLKCRQPQLNCWRRHSPIYKHGLSD